MINNRVYPNSLTHKLSGTTAKGFTLIEILIVVAVIAVLAVIVVLILNPAVMLQRSKDSRRLSDIKSLDKALALASVQIPEVPLGLASTTYISLPDPAATTTAGTDCASMAIALPTLPPGWQYHCAASSTLKNIDGTGWIPIDFTTFPGSNPIPTLPLDPINEASNFMYYSYVTDGQSWVLTNRFEYDNNNIDLSLNDNGVDDTRYELGDNSLWAKALGLMLYLPFDEGSGAIVKDRSGNGYQGTIYGASWIDGKKGKALSFDGVNDYVALGNFPRTPYNYPKGFSVVAIAHANSTSSEMKIISNNDGVNGSRQFELAVGGDASNYAKKQIWNSSGGSGIVYMNYGIDMNIVLRHSCPNWCYFFASSLEVANTRPLIAINGYGYKVAVGSGVLPMSNPSLSIGRRSSISSNYFNGQIDEVKIYNRMIPYYEMEIMTRTMGLHYY